MNLNRSNHNIVQYLSADNAGNIWEMAVSGMGFQSVGAQDEYPLKGHPAGYTFNPERGRILDEYAIVYITRGEGSLTSVHCPERKISKGSVFFLLPGEWHSYRPDPLTGWDEYYVIFHGRYVKNLLTHIVDPATPVFHIGMSEEIIKHFGEMLDCAKHNQFGFQALLNGLLLHIIGLICFIQQNQDYGTAAVQKIREACFLMQEHIYDKFTSKEIAQSVNMSYSNFRKSFKQYMGVAPHQYLLQLKLGKIKDLLSNTDMSIQEIAIKLNFESADYFSYFFRDKTGINPLSYRKEIENQRDKARKIHLKGDTSGLKAPSEFVP